jgi:ATP-binding cassette subfamily A (ABC1) protein 3
MGAIRHFNALLRKNFIVWKRNVCCSLCELMCPVFLMLIIVFIRVRIAPSAVEPSQDLLISQVPFYSPFTLDSAGDWTDLS